MTQQELEQLYKEGYKAVYWTAISLLKNKEEAEDVVQETFISAYESYDSLKDKSKALPWIKKIAANKCLNILTRTKTTTVEDEILENVESVPDDFLPDSIVESAEKRKIIMDIINNSLSEDSRMTIILFYFNELSIKEIAERLDIPQGTVLSRLNYAKKKIKKEVEKYEKDENDKLFAMGIPFLTLLFEKEAEQVPLQPIPPYIKALSASKATTAAKAAKVGARALLLRKIAIVAALAVALGGGGYAAYRVISGRIRSDRDKEISHPSKKPQDISVIGGVDPDDLDLKGGYVRIELEENFREDTSCERSRLYYDKEGNLVLENRYDDDGVLVYCAYSIYGKDGNISRKEMWEKTGSSNGTYETYEYCEYGLSRVEEGYINKDPEHATTYEYDDEGRLLTITKVYITNNKSYWDWAYVYNPDGSYTEIVHEFDMSKQDMYEAETNIFSADGRILEARDYAPLTLTVYSYDGTLCVKEEYFTGKKDSPDGYSDLEYDSDDRLTSKTTYDKDGNAKYKYSYTYKKIK